jgi:hypothetical protein
MRKSFRFRESQAAIAARKGIQPVEIDRNYAGNTPCTQVIIGNLTLWFSYGTIIALRHPATGKIVCPEVVHSQNSAKHVKAVQIQKPGRIVSREEFFTILAGFEINPRYVGEEEEEEE